MPFLLSFHPPTRYKEVDPMKKLLLPLDGSSRSLRTIDMVKKTFSPDQVSVTILMVLPNPLSMEAQLGIARTDDTAQKELDTFIGMLPGYQVTTALRKGTPGPEIVKFAQEEGFDSLCMTRATRGFLQKMGSVANYIVKNAPFLDLFIMREDNV